MLVLNDDHNTFDHVAETLARFVPGVTLADGYRMADQIHNQGCAIVWSGPREDAESYWMLLDDAGLTMGPPAEKLYAVDPVGVATTIASAA